MPLSVRTDDLWPGGGFALLRGDNLDGVTAVIVENCLSKLLLDAQGQWGKSPHLFPVARIPAGELLLGPDVVDHVPTELLILLRDQEGRDLGKIFWADILPSRNFGAATLADVAAIHERRPGSAEAPSPEPAPREKADAVPIGAPLQRSNASPRATVPIELPASSHVEEAPTPKPPPLPPVPPVEERQAHPGPVRADPPPLPGVPRREADLAASRLLPMWLTIALAGVFTSSLAFVVLIFVGVL